jgi:hypothetical protein
MQSLHVDEEKIPYLTEPHLASVEPHLDVDLADEEVPAAPANVVSLPDFLDHLDHPILAQFLEQTGIKSDLDLLDLLRWDEGDRNDWFYRFVMGKRLDPLQMEALRLEFQDNPFPTHPSRIDHQGFTQRMDDTGLWQFLSQVVGIKTEQDIRRVLRWDPSTRDPFFHRFTLTKHISLFQLEVLRQVFGRLEM